MALINLPDGKWIDILGPGYGNDYGEDPLAHYGSSPSIILEKNITPERVLEILFSYDTDNDIKVYEVKK